MEIVANKLDWLATDEINLAAFLETPTGQRFIPKLLEEAPQLLQKGDRNEILIRSGLVLGYQQVAQTILALAHPSPKTTGLETTDTHPSLDDGTKWPAPKAEPALEYQEPPQPDTNPTTPTI